MSPKRHAFAIMAHDQLNLAELFIGLLEHPQAKVLLHLNVDDIPGVVRRHPAFSKAALVPRVRVQWGTYSLLQAQFNLLTAALETDCDYVHMLSGKDLPLRPVGAIMDFINANDGCEFIEVQSAADTERMVGRVGRYHSNWLLSGKIRPGVRGLAMRSAQHVSLATQSLANIDRVRSWDRPIRSGSTWFSVTSKLARYFVSHADWAKAHLRQTFVPEEFFYATMVAGSPMSERTWSGRPGQAANLRHIKWDLTNRGHPHTWTAADSGELAESSNMFARKFDQSVDPEVIRSVVAMATPKDGKSIA